MRATAHITCRGAIWAQIAKRGSSAKVALSVTEGLLSSLGTLSQTVRAKNDGKGAVNITLGVDGGGGPRIRTLGEGIYAELTQHDPGTDAAATKSRIVVNFHSGDIDARYRGIGAWGSKPRQISGCRGFADGSHHVIRKD